MPASDTERQPAPEKQIEKEDTYRELLSLFDEVLGGDELGSLVEVPHRSNECLGENHELLASLEVKLGEGITVATYSLRQVLHCSLQLSGRLDHRIPLGRIVLRHGKGLDDLEEALEGNSNCLQRNAKVFVLVFSGGLALLLYLSSGLLSRGKRGEGQQWRLRIDEGHL